MVGTSVALAVAVVRATSQKTIAHSLLEAIAPAKKTVYVHGQAFHPKANCNPPKVEP